jgi:hypothetical protein
MITHNPHLGAVDWPYMDPALWTPEIVVHAMGSVTVKEGVDIYANGSVVEVVDQGRVVATLTNTSSLVLDALAGIATPGRAPDHVPRGRPLP